MTRKMIFEETDPVTGESKTIGLPKHHCRLRIDHKDIKFIYCSFMTTDSRQDFKPEFNDDSDEIVDDADDIDEIEGYDEPSDIPVGKAIPCTAVALHGDNVETLLIVESLEALSNCMDHADQMETSRVPGRIPRSGRTAPDGSWSHPLLVAYFEGPSLPRLVEDPPDGDIDEMGY